MHSSLSSILAYALTLQYSSATPLVPSLFTKRGGQVTDPTCWYDEGAVTCNGAPNDAWCADAARAACQIFSQMDPTNTTTIALIVGGESSSDSGLNAQCLVSVQNSGEGQAPSTTQAECEQKFQTLRGCQNSQNRNYKADCIGGNINVHFNEYVISLLLELFNSLRASCKPQLLLLTLQIGM